ncbi:MAG: hypothetical protein J6U38_06710, partial [Clostridia bacterium]|nr:hypothetical protein [Clostridia bacterium]
NGVFQVRKAGKRKKELGRRSQRRLGRRNLPISANKELMLARTAKIYRKETKSPCASKNSGKKSEPFVK